MRITTFLLILFICCGVRTNAQSQLTTGNLDDNGRWKNGVSEPWWFSDSLAKDDLAVAQARWSAIINQTNDELAGDYFIGGDTHGQYLRWSSGNGFVLFHVDKCAAAVMGFSYGRVIVSPGLVQLLPEKTAHSRTNHAHKSDAALRFLPVSWRRTQHLVPENRISDFADYTAGLGAYNERMELAIEFAPFFVKNQLTPTPAEESASRDVVRDGPGFIEPIMPPGYKRFVKRPINARINRVNRTYVQPDPENEWWDKLFVPVTINRGTLAGLKPKMVLHLVEDEGFGEDVIVTRVSVHSARGVIERSIRKNPCVKFDKTDDCSNPEYAPIKVGTILTTNPVAADFVKVAGGDVVPSP